VAGIEVAPHVGFVDAEDACLGERVVGEDAHLRAGVAPGFQAQVLERHRQQGDGDLLAGRHHHVELARVGLRLDFLRQRDQPVGFARHRREHDHHLMPEHLELGDAFRHGADAFGVGDRSAAVFLYDECHVGG
jgi:hypothetical protein